MLIPSRGLHPGCKDVAGGNNLVRGGIGGPLTFALLLLITLFAANGCGIGESAPLLDDFPVYFWGESSPNTLLVYHPAFRTLDSLPLAWPPSKGLNVSADGRWLYLATGHSVIVADTDSLGLVAELPFVSQGPVAVSPDNSLIALMGDSLRIVETGAWSVRFCLPLTVRRGAFSDDSRVLCCVGDSTDHNIIVVTLDSAAPPSIERIPFAGGYPRSAVPGPDAKRIIIYLEEQPMLHRLAVYDRLAGSEIYSEYIYPGEGGLATAAGWDRVVYTNPGSEFRVSGASSFRIFDIDANESVAEVNTLGDGSNDNHFIVSRVRVSPNHRWLVAFSANTPELLLYDLNFESVIDRRSFGGDSAPRYIAMQLVP